MVSSNTSQNVALGTGIGGGGLAGVMYAIRQAWPEFPLWTVEQDALIVGLVGTFLVPIVSRWIAFYRDPSKMNQSLKVRKYHLLPFIVSSGIAAASLSGCATMLPAVGGKTVYDVDFTDTTADQNTTYSMHVKAPAGVDLATVTGMTYDWRPDGSGAIAVSQQGNVDTTTQAAMITEVSRQQLEAFQAGLNTALNALAPILGQKAQSDDNQARIEAETEAEKLRAAIEIVERYMANTR